MWGIPLILCMKFGWWRFIWIWFIFSVITAFVTYKATRKPIAGTTPRFELFLKQNLSVTMSVTCKIKSNKAKIVNFMFLRHRACNFQTPFIKNFYFIYNIYIIFSLIWRSLLPFLCLLVNVHFKSRKSRK